MDQPKHPYYLSCVPTLQYKNIHDTTQIEKINALKANRDNTLANACLEAIKIAANTGQNIMPTVIAAVEAKCTLGEIADTLRNVFGEYQA